MSASPGSGVSHMGIVHGHTPPLACLLACLGQSDFGIDPLLTGCYVHVAVSWYSALGPSPIYLVLAVAFRSRSFSPIP